MRLFCMLSIMFTFITLGLMLFLSKRTNFHSCWHFPRAMRVLVIFTNPSARAGYHTRSILKRSLTGLNSEFSFSYTSCLTEGWRNQSVLLFTHSWRENNWINTFPKGISAMWNVIRLIQDLNSYQRVHFLWRSSLHYCSFLKYWEY